MKIKFVERLEFLNQSYALKACHLAALFRDQATDAEILVVTRYRQTERRMTQIDIYIEVITVQPGAQLNQCRYISPR
ncbi:hypothetical protein D3C81_1198780 [compost metagenome]